MVRIYKASAGKKSVLSDPYIQLCRKGRPESDAGRAVETSRKVLRGGRVEPLRPLRGPGRVAVGASCCAPWSGACILRPRPCREAATTGAISEGRTSVVNRRKGDYDAGKDRSPYHIRRRRRSILPPLKGSVWTTVPLEGKPLRSRVKPPLLGEVAAEGRRKGFAHSGYPEPYGQRKRRTAGSRPRPTTPKNTLSSHKTARQSSLPPGRIHAAPTSRRSVKSKPYRSHRGSVPEGVARPESRTPQAASRPAPLEGERLDNSPPRRETFKE